MDLEEEIDQNSYSLGRNDPCKCGSGVKYKKCCLERESKTAIVSTEDEALLSYLDDELHRHPDTITSKDCEYFKKLSKLRTKYPNNPLILNYIANGYQLLGEEELLKELIFDTYEKFPTSLSARLALANQYLNEGFSEKAINVVKRAYSLKQLYPDRTVFHISEVRAFEFFMVRYFLMLDNFQQANLHLKIMKDLLKEDDKVLQSAQTMLNKSKPLIHFRVGLSRLYPEGIKNRDFSKLAL